MNNIEWFREAKYGMMVHFGLYSMLAGEYRGRRTPYDYGEWIQSAFAIPNREMEQLAGAFNPVYFNAVVGKACKRMRHDLLCGYL